MAPNNGRRNTDLAFAGAATAFVLFVLLKIVEPFGLLPDEDPSIDEARLATFVVMFLFFMTSLLVVAISKKNPVRTHKWYPIEAYFVAAAAVAFPFLVYVTWNLLANN